MELSKLRAPSDLIVEASDIFDREDVAAQIDRAVADLSDAAAIRGAVVGILRQSRAAGLERISAAFKAAPFASQAATMSYCYLTDCAVAAAYDAALRYMHPRQVATTSEQLAIVAVGG
ncbi:[protein-PII] uridylyltransferase, partial [bacterium]|nr:[protein-PII] uridylyltransferase [bacterium]